MPEFDVPGHASSWCVGLPEICPSVSTNTEGLLNVANEETFNVIGDIVEETRDFFPDEFYHIGGDEVDTRAWNRDPEISAWLKDATTPESEPKANMTEKQAYEYFVKRTSQIVIDANLRPVVWDEVWQNFNTELDKATIIHIWRPGSQKYIKEATSNGYTVLVNQGYTQTSWYLDNLEVTWDKMYEVDICSTVDTDECKLVLGGHGEMWAESVDASNIEATVWPRMAAIAEKLWTPQSESSSADGATKQRIFDFRCLLNRRGIGAAPTGNKYARDAPGEGAFQGSGSCFDQRRR